MQTYTQSNALDFFCIAVKIPLEMDEFTAGFDGFGIHFLDETNSSDGA